MDYVMVTVRRNPAVHALTYSQFLGVAELNSQRLLSLRRRDQLALAFGRREVFKSLRYLAVDAVGMLIAEELARIFDRTFAASIVRVWWDRWLAAVARAEHRRGPWLFHVVESVDHKGRHIHFCCHGGFGDSEEAMRQVGLQLRADGYEPLRVVSINVSQIIQRVRRNARRAKLDLSAAFLPPLEDSRLLELLSSQAQRREHAKMNVAKAQDGEDDLARATIKTMIEELPRASEQMNG